MKPTVTYPLSTPGSDLGRYRYFFNGQESDAEAYGSGSLHAFEYRMHDTRIGRFWSVDPLAGQFPWNSVYAFAENSPIGYLELEGLETKPLNPQPFKMENISYSVTFPSDNTKVVLPIMSKIELKLKMDTNMRTPFQGEIRVGKSEYEEFLEVVSGPLGDNIRTDYVLQAVSGGIFSVYSWSVGEQVMTKVLPYAMRGGDLIKSTTINLINDTRVKIGIGVVDGVVSYKFDLPPDISWPEPVVTFTSQITQLGIKELVKNNFFDDPKAKQDTNDNHSKKP